VKSQAVNAFSTSARVPEIAEILFFPEYREQKNTETPTVSPDCLKRTRNMNDKGGEKKKSERAG